MLNLLELRRNFERGKDIFTMPLRVTYYARVSSLKDSQLNSLDNQMTFFENYIKENENWTLVHGYVDEGIRGESAENRERFMDMIADSANDEFDLIITKEVSRFARNTIDSLVYTRKLLSNKVGVFFLNDNINTLSSEGELRLTIMSSLAQDEARRLSERVRFGHAQSIRKGVVLGNSRIYGYDKDGGKLVINEKEAEMVRKVFEYYVIDDLSLHRMEQVLYNEGYRSRTGGKIAHNTLGTIIKNPKYKGYYCGNKVKIVDFMTKEQQFLDESEWVMYKDETGEIVPQIVDEELWEKANIKYKAQTERYKARIKNGYHTGWGRSNLSNKIFCANCGTPYWRDVVCGAQHKTAGKEFWKCSYKKKNGRDSCPSITLYENDILQILKATVQEFLEYDHYHIDEYLKISEAALSGTDATKAEEVKLTNEIEKIKQKKDALLELYMEKVVSKAEMLERNAALNKKLEECTRRINEIQKENVKVESVEERISEIRKCLEKAVVEKDLSLDVLLPFVDRIDVGTPNENGETNVVVTLFNGEKTENFCNFRRTGNIFKKMIESYEQNLSK